MSNSLDNLLSFHQQALSLRGFRQQLLASNIANGDTPNYKARDIDLPAPCKRRSGRAVPPPVRVRRWPLHRPAIWVEMPREGRWIRPQCCIAACSSTASTAIPWTWMWSDRFAENAVHVEANLLPFSTARSSRCWRHQVDTGVTAMSSSKFSSIAGSAMTAQSQRLNVVASNLANADSVTSSNGQPYRAKQVVFSDRAVRRRRRGSGVKVVGVIEDPSPRKQVFDPKHPLADAQGYVAMPNVSVVEEMVNMISAARSYQNNVEMMNTAQDADAEDAHARPIGQ